MARVTESGLDSLIILTISAFYLGDILQAINTELEQDSLINCYFILSFAIILNNDSPATTVAEFLIPSELIYIFLLSAI